MELIRQIFSTSNRHKIWLDIETIIIKFFHLKGYISRTLCEKIIVNLRIPAFELFGNVKQGEDEWASFIKMLYSEMKFLDKELMDFALSRDNFVDIANVLCLNKAGKEVEKKALELKDVLKELALKYKELPQIGRTHGMHAEPTSFGHKYLVYYADIERELKELSKALKKTNCLCVNYNCLFDSSLAVELQDFLAKYLKIELTGNTNTSPKHKYQRYLSALNVMAQSVARIMEDMKLLEKVGEVRIKDTRVIALAKVIQGYANMDYLQDSKLLFEVINNSYELLVDAIVALRELEVNEEVIRANIELTKGTVFSNTVMCHLINNVDDTRADVLRNLKEISTRTANNDYPSFEEGLKYSKYFEYINDELFETEYHLRFMDELYEKIFEPLREQENIDFFVNSLAKELNKFYYSKESILIVGFFERTLKFVAKLLSKLKFPVNLINIEYESKLHPLVVNKFKNQKVLILDYFVDEKTLLPILISNLKKVGTKEVRVCALYKENDLSCENLINWYGSLSHNRNKS
ncbi:hypothetical protein A6V39_02815 [Candidatus Mycoplasma haematobovis]|uniref:Fumarate lyase N-terminal domain-containing protein n=1 Tax=Candidatus Mycoplasma haematobovis TaxID=432608 RepID=A0A1A9QEG3_9MOLU|nr:lyase family protein [Candidatus Mycoplasma haematobovis]OAL10345.1 hypothetical protein A6V39_02815 [Candidatus Mycoplasma haematobovis]